MNRLIKSALFALFVVIILASANMVKNNQTDAQIRKIYALPNYTQVYLPPTVLNGSQAKILQLIEGVSGKDTSFIFRTTYVGWQNNGKGTADFTKSLDIIKFYRTDFSGVDKRVFISHGFTYDIENQKLNQLTTLDINNSEVFIENSAFKNTIPKLIQAIKKSYGVTTDVNKLTVLSLNSHQQGDIIGYNNDNLILLIGVSLLFFAVFLFVWLVDNNQKIAIFALNGLGSIKIAKLLLIKEFLTVATFIFVLTQFLIFKSFNLIFASQFLVLVLIVFGITYLTVLLVSQKSLSTQVNNQSFFRYGHLFLYAIKILVFIVSISSTMSLVELVNKTGGTSLENAGENYGVLYPMTIGYNLNKASIPPNGTNTFLYGERHGALYVLQSDSSFLDGESINDVAVNTNYLKKFPIYDENNQRINISDTTTEGVVLISEKLKPKLTDIKKMYASTLVFSSTQISYFFIKANQNINLLDENASKTSPDLIEVYTGDNASGDLMSMSLTSPALKFPITHNLQATYQKLKVPLSQDGVEANFPSFISLNEMKKADVLTTVGNVSNFAVTNSLIFLIFTLMVLITSTFYIRVYKKKIAIARLQGVSFVRTYRELFLVLILQYGTFYLYSLTQNNSVYIIEAFLFYFVIEIVILLGIFYKLEKTLLLDTLKGE